MAVYQHIDVISLGKAAPAFIAKDGFVMPTVRTICIDMFRPTPNTGDFFTIEHFNATTRIKQGNVLCVVTITEPRYLALFVAKVSLMSPVPGGMSRIKNPNHHIGLRSKFCIKAPVTIGPNVQQAWVSWWLGKPSTSLESHHKVHLGAWRNLSREPAGRVPSAKKPIQSCLGLAHNMSARDPHASTLFCHGQSKVDGWWSICPQTPFARGNRDDVLQHLLIPGNIAIAFAWLFILCSMS